MAKKNKNDEKLQTDNSTKKTKSIWRKIGLGTLGLGAVAGTAIGLSTIKPKEKTPENPIQDKLEETPEVNFDTATLIDPVNSNLSNELEFYLAGLNSTYPIKESHIASFTANETSIKFYVGLKYNKQDFPISHCYVEFGGTEYSTFYNDVYSLLKDKINNNTISDEEVKKLTDGFLTFMTSNNIISFSHVERINDSNTTELTQKVIANHFGNSLTNGEITQDDYNVIISNLVGGEYEIRDSHFTKLGMKGDKYLYDYFADITCGGSNFKVSTVISTKSRLVKTTELTKILLDSYIENASAFTVDAAPVNATEWIFGTDYYNFIETENQIESETEEEQETETATPTSAKKTSEKETEMGE